MNVAASRAEENGTVPARAVFSYAAARIVNPQSRKARHVSLSSLPSRRGVGIDPATARTSQRSSTSLAQASVEGGRPTGEKARSYCVARHQISRLPPPPPRSSCAATALKMARSLDVFCVDRPATARRPLTISLSMFRRESQWAGNRRPEPKIG